MSEPIAACSKVPKYLLISDQQKLGGWTQRHGVIAHISPYRIVRDNEDGTYVAINPRWDILSTTERGVKRWRQ